MKSALTIALVTLSALSQAETIYNQQLRWVIDGNGTPRSNIASVTGWFDHALPDSQKAKAISSDYYHYQGPGSSNQGFDGSTFAISTNGNAFRFSNGQWKRSTGCWGAKDITSYNIDQSFCVVGDGSVHQYNPQDNNFYFHSYIDGESIEKIDVGNDGILWAVTKDADLYKFDQQWQLVHQAGDNKLYVDDVASNGEQVYTINYHFQVGAPAIYEFRNDQFEKIASGYVDVEVDRSGYIWARGYQDNRFMLRWNQTLGFVPVGDYPYQYHGLQSLGM